MKRARFRRIWSLILTYAMVLTLLMPQSAFAGGISQKKATVVVKQTVQLSVTGANGTVKWKSSNKKVAKVSRTGLVKGKRPGKAVISAQVGGKTYKCKVKVKIGLSQKAVSLTVGQSTVVKLCGTKVKKTVSSNPAVATVTKRGAVHAVGTGSAVLTYTGKNKKKYRCTVTVAAASVPQPVIYTVTFDSNGGSAVPSQRITAGSRASRPADPSRAGYHFNGWYLHGDPYSFDQAVNSNITLTAAWEASDNLTDGTIDRGDLETMVMSGQIDVDYGNRGNVEYIDGPFTGDKVNNAAQAAAVLNTTTFFGEDFNAGDCDVSESSAAGEQLYRFSPKVGDVPVIGSQIILSAGADGTVSGLSTSYNTAINDVYTSPGISSDEAKEKALDQVMAGSDITNYIQSCYNAKDSGDETTLETMTAEFRKLLKAEPKLVIYAADPDDSPVLVYQVLVSGPYFDSAEITDSDDAFSSDYSSRLIADADTDSTGETAGGSGQEENDSVDAALSPEDPEIISEEEFSEDPAQADVTVVPEEISASEETAAPAETSAPEEASATEETSAPEEASATEETMALEDAAAVSPEIEKEDSEKTQSADIETAEAGEVNESASQDVYESTADPAPAEILAGPQDDNTAVIAGEDVAGESPDADVPEGIIQEDEQGEAAAEDALAPLIEEQDPEYTETEAETVDAEDAADYSNVAPFISRIVYVKAGSGSIYRTVDLKEGVSVNTKDVTFPSVDLGSVEAEEVSSGSFWKNYALQDKSRNIDVYKTKYTGHLWWKKAEVPGTIAQTILGKFDSDAAYSMVNMEKVYDYYNSIIGRRSFDGNGANVKVTYNYHDPSDGPTYYNAFWSSQIQQFVIGNDGNLFKGLDVLGHEFTHAVINYVVGNGHDVSLTYENESGALNESYADIMGNLIEGDTGDGRWLIAEDTDQTLRSMSSPRTYNQPEHYDNRVTDQDDNGGVHSNSGIFNRAAYLMMTDSRCSGIGSEEWAKVFYYSLFRLPSDSTFLQARRAIICVANRMGFNHDQQQAVKDAFDTVGIIEKQTVRFVLQWGQEPQDLDSHLVGSLSDGNKFHIYFGDKIYSEENNYIADLDYDDTTSYGPEVTTIYSLKSGDSFRFYVHDYSTGSSSTSTVMAHSGATVSVFWGSEKEPKAVYHIDPGSQGVVWNICDIKVEGSSVNLYPVTTDIYMGDQSAYDM